MSRPRSAARDDALIPEIDDVLAALRECATAVGELLAQFEAALAADREADEHAGAQLRECAQQEAELHQRMSACNDALTAAEIKLSAAATRSPSPRAELRRSRRASSSSPSPRPSRSTDEQRETLTAAPGARQAPA